MAYEILVIFRGASNQIIWLYLYFRLFSRGLVNEAEQKGIKKLFDGQFITFKEDRESRG